MRVWEADEIRRLSAGLDFFRSRLETYGLARRAEDERDGKTTHLPSGRIETRQSGSKVIVEDEEAVLEWAQSLTPDERDRVVKVVESVRLTGLRELVKIANITTPDESGDVYPMRAVVHAETGEVVPGCWIDDGGTTATVRVER